MSDLHFANDLGGELTEIPMGEGKCNLIEKRQKTRDISKMIDYFDE